MNKKIFLLLLFIFSCVLSKADDNDYYKETPRDGDKGASIAQQLNLEKSGNKKTDWAVDVASRIQVHGYAQGGYDFQNVDGKITNSFKFRRAYFWINGQLTNRWSVLFMMELGGIVHEFYTDFRVTNNNLMTVRLGAFKHSFTYENPLSPTAVEAIDVCSESVTYLAGSGTDPLQGTTYGRDLGLTIFGETNNKKFRYEVSLMNGQGIGRKDLNNQKDVILNLQYRPIQGLNLVASGYLGTGCAVVGNTIFNPTINEGDNYQRNRLSLGFDYKSPHVKVHGEYLWGKDAAVKSKGVYITGAVPIFKDFEFVGSYDYFNFNTDMNYELHKFIAGFQYWFFQKCRLQAQYVYRSANTDYKTFFDKTTGCHQILCQLQFKFN